MPVLLYGFAARTPARGSRLPRVHGASNAVCPGAARPRARFGIRTIVYGPASSDVGSFFIRISLEPRLRPKYRTDYEFETLPVLEDLGNCWGASSWTRLELEFENSRNVLLLYHHPALRELLEKDVFLAQLKANHSVFSKR